MKYFSTKTKSVILLFWIAFAGMSSVNAQNSIWKCVKQADDIRVYSRKSDSANYRIIKVTTQLKTTLSSLVMLVTDFPNNKSWVYMHKKTEILERNNPYSWIIYNQTDAPWPITDRDIITKTVLKQDSTTKTVTIIGKAIPEYGTKDPDYVRIPFALSQWCFVPLKDSLVDVSFTLELDVGGNIPRWLANMTATKGPYETMRRFRKEIHRKKYCHANLSFIKEP